MQFSVIFVIANDIKSRILGMYEYILATEGSEENSKVLRVRKCNWRGAKNRSMEDFGGEAA